MNEYYRVRLDDTLCWDLDFLTEHKVIKIKTIYVLDNTKVTYCCELTPSYELQPSHYEFTTLENATPQEIEDTYEAIEDSFCLEENKYVHCRVINKLELEPLGPFESMEDAIEYSGGNR